MSSVEAIRMAQPMREAGVCQREAMQEETAEASEGLWTVNALTHLGTTAQ